MLKFCATLPVSGAAPDTVGWIDRQLSPAAVGYSAVLDHNGIRYALSYSQYDTNRAHYEIAVRPAELLAQARPGRRSRFRPSSIRYFREATRHL